MNIVSCFFKHPFVEAKEKPLKELKKVKTSNPGKEYAKWTTRVNERIARVN